MVSSVVNLTTPQLREALAAFPEKYGGDEEYQTTRAFFPADWPM